MTGPEAVLARSWPPLQTVLSRSPCGRAAWAWATVFSGGVMRKWGAQGRGTVVTQPPCFLCGRVSDRCCQRCCTLAVQGRAGVGLLLGRLSNIVKVHLNSLSRILESTLTTLN